MARQRLHLPAQGLSLPCLPRRGGRQEPASQVQPGLQHPGLLLLQDSQQEIQGQGQGRSSVLIKSSYSLFQEVQIIPWVLSDSNYVRCNSSRLDPQKTVFVGALHGMMTAQALAVVFNDLFQGET